MIAARFAQLFVELFVVVVVSSWQIHSFELLISGNLGISHCSHSCKHGWFKNVHFAQDHCKVVVFWLFNTVDEAEEIIFETLDIMEGVDGMLELDFIVVDGTSAKDLDMRQSAVLNNDSPEKNLSWNQVSCNLFCKKTLLSRSFCQNIVRVNFRNFHIVSFKRYFLKRKMQGHLQKTYYCDVFWQRRLI